VFATCALMAGLVVLSLLAFAVLPGPTASGSSAGLVGRLPSGGGFFEDSDTPPADLSFVCGETVSYWEGVRLSADEKDRAQAAVEDFVMTAYGDPSADHQAYEASVEPLVVGECFWASSPGSNADKMGEVARAGGKGTIDPFTSSGSTSPAYALDLVLFDPQVARHKTEGGAGYLAVEGTAVWVVEGPDGELEGRQQRLELARREGDEEGWKVFSGQGIPPAAYVTEYRQAVNQKIDELQYGT
jgi:hypothetical protein